MKKKPRKQRRAKQQRRAPLAPIDPRQRYEINEGSAYLRQSRAKTYEDIAAGRIKTLKCGKRRYIPGSEIVRLSTLPA